MWKWLILILAVYALYRLFANDVLKKKKENNEENAAEMERKIAAGEMIKDPECGTYVSAEGNISVRDGEKRSRRGGPRCEESEPKRRTRIGTRTASEVASPRRSRRERPADSLARAD